LLILSKKISHPVYPEIPEIPVILSKVPMHKPTTSPLEIAVSRLAETYHPEAIWLFGSAARNQAGPDSDYDLLMIVPDDTDRQHRQSELAYRALRSLGRAFDISIWRRSVFDEQSRSATSLPSTVLTEGRLLYAA